jgi:hypothetical protein
MRARVLEVPPLLTHPRTAYPLTGLAVAARGSTPALAPADSITRPVVSAPNGPVPVRAATVNEAAGTAAHPVSSSMIRSLMSVPFPRRASCVGIVIAVTAEAEL